MWEEIKHDEKDPRMRGKSWNEDKSPPKTTHPPTTQPNPPKDTTHPSSTETKPERKAENRQWRPRGPKEWPRGPKEFASGRNEKGERICFTYGSTEHTLWYHRKDKKDDKVGTDQKKPGIYVVYTT